ncbi:MAG: deoxynucleoside kinase [Saprospirales bacterium]|nr:MAG: deoxynucleoside kinase [Saprospirales bacterium]
MSSVIPYNFMAIEGNIGSGKTTLCKRLSQEENAELILEGFTDNPFLKNFYDNPERYGLQVELFFLSERYKQLSTFPIGKDLFDNLYVSDYMFMKSLLFAMKNLSGHEMSLFRRIYDMVETNLPAPDIVFYLYRSIDQLLHLIKKRNRPYEQNIRADYLEGIQSAYLSYFEALKDIPVVVIDCQDLDFENKEEDWAYIKQLTFSSYNTGVNYRGPRGNPLFE